MLFRRVQLMQSLICGLFFLFFFFNLGVDSGR